MAVQIPQIEPRQARAGDTWRWQISLPDYPADTWTLTYKLHNAAALVTFTATADGALHDINVPATTTEGYAAGRYDLVGQVSNGTDKFSVRAGSIEILPEITAATDGRSHARRMLDAINAMLESRATDGDLDVVKTTHGDMSVDYDLEKLMQLRRMYAGQVQREQRALAQARGDNISAIQMQFRR